MNPKFPLLEVVVSAAVMWGLISYLIYLVTV